jgi:hypothetical protein
MTSDLGQDFGALQINNNAALVVKAIVQDLGSDDDGTSTLTSFSSSSSSVPTCSKNIELHIERWANWLGDMLPMLRMESVW